MVDDTTVGRRGMLAVAVAATAGLAAVSPAVAQDPVTLRPRVPGQSPPETLPGFTGGSTQVRPTPLPPLPPGQRIGFAVVGLGRLSVEEILPAFGQSKLARPVALVTGDRAKGLRIAAEHGIPESAVLSYAEYDRLSDLRDVQAVYVVLPNGLHREYVIRAARANKHVLVEKPMALNAAEAEEMVQACAAANRLLMVAYRCQYTAHHNALRKLVQGGEGPGGLGRVKLIEAHNGQVQGAPDQWRHKLALAGGGALPDIGLYCLNTARFVLGEEPVEVSAATGSTPGDPRFREVEEWCAVRIRFGSGVVASFTTSYDTHEARRMRVLGTEGWADMDPAFSYSGLRLTQGRRSPENPRQEQRVTIDPGADPNPFSLELDHMAECILAGRRPWTPGEEGVQDHRIMDAIYASAREGKAVALPAVSGRDAFRGSPPAMAG